MDNKKISKEEFEEYSIEELVEFCNENGLEDYIDDIVTAERLDEIVAERAGEGMEAMKIFLEDISWMNDEYYKIDGYSNAKNVEAIDTECLISDILKNEAELFTEEEEEDEEVDSEC